jgi:hypothetical protein
LRSSERMWEPRKPLAPVRRTLRDILESVNAYFSGGEK